MRLAHLLGSPATGDDLVRPDDVGGYPAFQTLLSDGVLRLLRDTTAVPAGTPVTAAHRAQALVPIWSARTVVGIDAAAWVHTGGQAPARVTLLYDPRHHRPAPGPEHTSHQARLTGVDVEQLNGVAVTTPLRTALDVAVRSDTPVAWLRRLLAAGLLDPATLLHHARTRVDLSRSGTACAIVEQALGVTPAASAAPAPWNR
ncbi:MAG: hypothetical protein ACTMIR_04580 [Cellulomonadaceae bacterium]